MWSFYSMICLTAGHNAKPIFCSCHSCFDICVMEEKQWGLIGLGRLKIIAFASQGSEEEDEGPGFAVGDPILLFFSQMKSLAANEEKHTDT